MGRPEHRVESYLRRRVREEGGQIRKVRWIGRRGAADNLVWFTFPRVALVEVKAEGGDIDWRSPQGREMQRMREHGWPVYVVSSKEQVDDMIAEVKRGPGLAERDFL